MSAGVQSVLERLKQRYGERWYLPWIWLLPLGLLLLSVLLWWAHLLGQERAGFYRESLEQEVRQLNLINDVLIDENSRLNKRVAEFEQQIKIEQAATAATLEQLKALGREHQSQQQDLAFFQDITAGSSSKSKMQVQRLDVAADQLPGEYHLQMMLTRRGQRLKVFEGYFQLVVTLGDGQKTLILPQGHEDSAPYELSFRYYQRVEQHIKLMTADKVSNIQVRIFDQDKDEVIRHNASFVDDASKRGGASVEEETAESRSGKD